MRVRLDDGREVVARYDTVEELPDGSYRLSLGHDAAAAPAAAAGLDAVAAEDRVVLPVVEEALSVGRRVVETGRVRVRKVVREEQQQVDQAVMREELVVARVPVGRVVDAAPAVRQEGDVTIFPVVEEVVVVQKQLVLREEVHVRREVREVREPQTVSVRREEVRVERVPLSESGAEGTDVA